MVKKMIPFAPALDDPETAKRVSDLITQRNHADYHCYQILCELEQNGFQNDEVENDEEDLYARVREAIENRQNLNNEFLMALTGTKRNYGCESA